MEFAKVMYLTDPGPVGKVRCQEVVSARPITDNTGQEATLRDPFVINNLLLS